MTEACWELDYPLNLIRFLASLAKVDLKAISQIKKPFVMNAKAVIPNLQILLADSKLHKHTKW